MQFDIRAALKRGAPLPDGGPDIEAILRGGKRLRIRRRITMAATAAAVVALAALVAPNLDSLLASRDRTPPAKPSDRRSVPPAPKANGKIAFVRSVPIPGEPAADYTTTLYLLRPGDDTPEPLLEGVFYREAPAWSPDGTRLAALVSGGLRIVHVTTGEVSRVRWCEDCSQPTWSAAGTRLLFSGRRDGQTGLWTVREDGSDLRLLRAGDFEGRTPNWSPDGSLIAIATFGDEPDGTGARILMLDVHGGTDPAAIEPPVSGFIEGFGWAPDGRSIVMAAHADSGEGGIYVADIGTGEARLIESCGGRGCLDLYPTFSPDGRQIAFTRSTHEVGSDGFIGDVMLVDAQGGEPQLLGGARGLDCCPAWQPLPEG